MSMKDCYEAASKAQNAKQSRLEQEEEHASEQSKGEFKAIQEKFVDWLVEKGRKDIDETCANDNHRGAFVDVLRFGLPPKKPNDIEVEFEGKLIIELMEGSENSDYETYFKERDTRPTKELLDERFAPFPVFYGFLRRFGNVVQVRWDDVVPGWALNTAEDFDKKKDVSRSKRQQRNERRRNEPNNKQVKRGPREAREAREPRQNRQPRQNRRGTDVHDIVSAVVDVMERRDGGRRQPRRHPRNDNRYQDNDDTYEEVDDSRSHRPNTQRDYSRNASHNRNQVPNRRPLKRRTQNEYEEEVAQVEQTE